MAAAHERFAQLVYSPDPIDGSRTVTDYRWQPGDPRRYGQAHNGNNTWWNIIDEEITAGVTPVNYFLPPGMVERYQTYQAGVDMAVGLQAAFNMTPYVKATTQERRTYTCNNNLTFPAANNLHLDFNGSDIDFNQNGLNISFTPIGGTTMPNNGVIENISINVNNASATGLQVRCSHFDFRNVVVTMRHAATGAAAYELKGPSGSVAGGPYYNNFYNCDVQGSGAADGQTGWAFTSIAPDYLGPNANNFYGGRVGQCATARSITGLGNNWYAPTSEGNTTAFDFFETHSLKCIQNNVFGGYYENNTTLFNFAAGATGNRIMGVFETGTTNVSTGTNAPQTLPAQGNRVYAFKDATTELPDYYASKVAFPSAPSITFATPGNLAVGTNNSTGYYTRIGDSCFFDIDLNLAGPTFTTASGTLRVINLPFTISTTAPAPSFTVGFKSTGPTFVAGKTWMQAVGVPGTTYMILEQMGSNTATHDTDNGDLVSGAALRLSISGRYSV